MSSSSRTQESTSRAAHPRHPARFTGRAALEVWVAGVAALALPDEVVWWDGRQESAAALAEAMVQDGALIRLDPGLRPNSYLARSDADDVARIEDRTFICAEDEADAGPTNNWRAPDAMRAELSDRFAGAMRGRTMFVVPFSLGPVGGPLSQVGVQVTDSPYAVLSMGIMTRTGAAVLDALTATTPWVPAAHSVGAPLVDDRGERVADVPWPSNPEKVVAHFPETREIWSFGSGYGGNALLAKKCFALRIASVIARDEGWLAEHMLLIRVTTPAGGVHHIAAAFPSACGKTNLAMLTSTRPGWRVETLGDDIAWLRRGPDGRLRAANPEAGFFGVAPGTGEATNPVAMATVAGDTVFTNVALRDDGDVWWEGMTAEAPEHLVDWRGEDWTPASGRTAAHPNARFTAPATRCPTLADDWGAPEGVPLDAVVFGGRRAGNVPLVAEADDWAHGVFLGATVSSEQTAAAEGPVGELRFDPFAMQPFCGYNMADHWQHWLDVGDDLGDAAPRVFRVNWFRKDAGGRFLWPGFGDNIRVLEWIVDRIEGAVEAEPGPVGRLPRRQDLDLEGLELSDGDLDLLLEVDPRGWLEECEQIEQHFARFGDRLPERLAERLRAMRRQLAARAR